MGNDETEDTDNSPQSFAREALTFFTTVTRDSGETIVTTKDDRPDWLTKLIFHAHDDGDTLPDDWRYETIREALDAIADAEDLDDAASEFEADADVYTSDLTAWLHSRNSRHEYVNEAVREFGATDDVMKDIANGQSLERREVFDRVRESLMEVSG